MYHLLNLLILAPELQLVPKLRQRSVDQSFSRDVMLSRTPVRRSDTEHMRHKLWAPLRGPVDYDPSPVVSAEDDFRGADGFGDPGYGVGMILESEVLDFRGGACLAVAHAVNGDATEAQGEEHRDLVAPGEGYVWEAVDQDNGTALVTLWCGVKVVLKSRLVQML